MPFKLEDALSENSGGKFEKASADWGECVKVAKNGNTTVITGQNPASGQFLVVRNAARRELDLIYSFFMLSCCCWQGYTQSHRCLRQGVEAKKGFKNTSIIPSRLATPLYLIYDRKEEHVKQR
jgi:hypothetical protein